MIQLDSFWISRFRPSTEQEEEDNKEGEIKVNILIALYLLFT